MVLFKIYLYVSLQSHFKTTLFRWLFERGAVKSDEDGVQAIMDLKVNAAIETPNLTEINLAVYGVFYTFAGKSKSDAHSSSRKHR